METVPFQKSYVKDFIMGMPEVEADIILKKFYDGVYQLAGYYPGNGANKWKVINDTIGSVIEKREKMLDVGCGPGLCVKAMCESGHDAYGVDLATLPEMWEKNGVKDRCITANAKYLPFSDGEFGVVTCMDVLEHIREEDVPQVLRELFRVSNKITALSISLLEENEPVYGRIYSHITIHDSGWWKEQLANIGIHNFIEAASVDRYNVCHWRGTVRH